MVRETARKQRGEESRRELRTSLSGGAEPRQLIGANRILELCRWWLSAPRLLVTLRDPLSQVESMALAMTVDPSSALAFETARMTRGLDPQLALLADQIVVVKWEEAGSHSLGTGSCRVCGKMADINTEQVRGLVLYAQDCRHCGSHTICTMEDGGSLRSLPTRDDHVVVHELELFLRK